MVKDWGWRACLILVCRGFLFTALCCSDDRSPDGECQQARRDSQWEDVLATCKGERWSERRELAKGALLQKAGKGAEALAVLEPLFSSSEAAEAAYLAGHARFNSDIPEIRKLARARWELSLELFKRADDPSGISKSALFLSNEPRPEYLFDDALNMAKLAVAEGERSKNDRTLGRAVAALAKAYDLIGMEEAARDNFLRAEELLPLWPDQMSQTFLQHGSFLLDIATPQSLEAALKLYETAEQFCETAESKGKAADVAKVRFALPLNRATALSQLGRLDEAERVLDDIRARADKDLSSSQQERLHLVAGYLAARRHKPEEAAQHFNQAALDEDDEEVFDGEYRWRARYELALAYRATGKLEQAEEALRAAIATTEKLRSRSAQLELRPWILAHRSSPHRELLSLLIELRRHEEALAVAESLHTRAWLDAVLATRPDDTADHAATVASARKLVAAKTAPPPTSSELMAAIGDREALVYLFLGSAIWRAHVRDGAVTFAQLPPSAAKLISELRANPDSPSRAKASAILLPADLSRSREPLYIVAHGDGDPDAPSGSSSGTGADLAAFPFAALLLGGRPIIATRPIARLPGLAALRCRASGSTASTWDDRAVFLGNSRGDLPEAEREVKQQSARHPRSTAHVGPSATRRALDSARGADLLHVAVHGVSTPSGQALQLADAKPTAADILAAGIDPRLVVLSGCATAVSAAPEAWNGFPSAFLAAGSRYVIATLRSVGDAEAAQVIDAYYQQPATLTPIHRLAAAQAQLATSSHADAPSTRAWASFSAWGNAECEEDPIPAAITPLSIPLFGL